MDIIIRGYTLKQELFSNGLFKVYIAEHSILNDQKLRITLLNPEFMELPELKSEFSSLSFKLSFADHPNIIRNTDMLEENGNFAVLSENISLKSFDDFIANTPFENLQPVIEKVFEGLIFLNDKKIYHSALSPENIFIDNESNPRIAYYGLTGIFLKANNPEIREVILEKLSFYAPELREKQTVLNDNTEVYSCGRLLEYVQNKYKSIENDKSLSYIINKSTDSDPRKRYRNVKELYNDFKNPDKIKYIPIVANPVIKEPVKKEVVHNQKVENKEYPQQPKYPNEQNQDFNSEVKNVFTIIDEIKNHIVEPNNQTNQNSTNPQQRQYTPPPSANTSQTNYQSRPNSTTTVFNQQKQIKPYPVLFLGLFSMMFSFIFWLFGIILAVVGFSILSSNKKIAKDQKISLKSSDNQVQNIGAIFCVIAIIISVLKAISFVTNLFI